MLNDQSRNRMNKLFSEIEQLVPKPNGNGSQPHPVPPTPSSETAGLNGPASMLQEMETLRARILELEAQLEEKGRKAHSAPILYEKEEVGFAYSDNTLVPLRREGQAFQHRADVIRTPLTFSGRAIGEVQVVGPSEHPLSQDDLKLVDTIAQQASLQIENLRLLAAAERARTEAEEATH